MPAAQVALAEQHLRPEEVQATGPGGRILKEDVLRRAGQGDRPFRRPRLQHRPNLHRSRKGPARRWIARKKSCP